ncbi:MAG: precorrin-6y C5,15-methyltransferase (decarboxylating) subunit CbiE [Methanobacterium sp.]
MSKLHLVGIGPGSKEYLTFKAVSTVESCDILIGSKRALELFSEVDADKIELGAHNMGEMLNYAVSKACEGRSVALLSTGDPGFSGVLKPILKLTGNLEFDVTPGVSSVQICASKLKIPWDEANIITMHGKGISNELITLLDNGKPTIILPNTTVEGTTKYLLAKGIDPSRKVSVCENISYDNEKIVSTTLEEVLNNKFGYMCVMVVY